MILLFVSTNIVQVRVDRAEKRALVPLRPAIPKLALLAILSFLYLYSFFSEHLTSLNIGPSLARTLRLVNHVDFVRAIAPNSLDPPCVYMPVIPGGCRSLDEEIRRTYASLDRACGDEEWTGT